MAAVLALGATGLLPGSAMAKNTVAPPGNSGVSQYMEDIPTVHGNKPTSSVVIPTNNGGGGGSSSGTGGSGSSGASGSSGTSSGSGDSSGAASSSVIPSAVVKKLEHSGSAGRAAVALAQATSSAPIKSKPRKATPAAPATSVVRALTGSTGGGGLGAFLPVLLIGLLVILSAVGIFQRRRPT